MSTRRATIADVARTAGVSPSTASVVFSGKTAVSDATRERVLQAASDLGYTGPDPRAASLRRGRSGIVGVLFQGHLGAAFVDPVVRAMMDGLADAVAPMDAGLLLLRHDADGTTGGASLTNAPIDAAVLVGWTSVIAESLQTLRARGIPVVVVEGDAGPDVPRVILDNREAQRALASHVRSLGHTDVALLTLPTDIRRRPGWLDADGDIGVDVTRHRLEGAREVYPDAPAYAAAGSSIDEGAAAGRAILADPQGRPTAVLAQSDLLAAGVLRAAEELGLRVPDDLSVTGFDGIAVDGLAPFDLTTMVQPAMEKGRAAGEAVVAMLEGNEAPSVCFSSVYREGNTTAPMTR
ncbi:MULTISPECIES: LacI family DNA-binding transcriptional regulator [unclassified Microbacterium]|uniref:LacI family DNA-binding transcriptional regulator n=1 Tax=unclassified Microbacterium TaxID=2609290 RepID=UPI00214CFD88|nr:MULTISPECIES: LacI family DNA-binding transcriptional regulator [unclassified Microbacterium]MCR2801942.1 LacI family DNA-binding transcriptional regulator [Microbacterium sp. zg.Y818]MCR2824788.1 LacI family DNA-binding transcriptional regulator [Microbacterium sp. zg.Y909]WIM22499.1 LacI family DNA-binding transcriptional regulator [Microbacterium sp. zg-Y818]